MVIVYFLHCLSYSISLLFLVRLCCWILGDSALDLVGAGATSFRAVLSRQHLVDAFFAFFSDLDVHESEKGFDGVSTYEVDVKLVINGDRCFNFFLLSALLRPLQWWRANVLLALNFTLIQIGFSIRVYYRLDWSFQVIVCRKLMGSRSGFSLVHFLVYSTVKTVSNCILLFEPLLEVLFIDWYLWSSVRAIL